MKNGGWCSWVWVAVVLFTLGCGGSRLVMPTMEGGRLQPAYPPTMRDNGTEADVMVRSTIGSDGRVTHVRLIGPSRHPEFNRAAQQAAWSQRFSPARLGGEPITYSITYSYRFRLSTAPLSTDMEPTCLWHSWSVMALQKSSCAPPLLGLVVEGKPSDGVHMQALTQSEGWTMQWTGKRGSVQIMLGTQMALWDEAVRLVRLGGPMEGAPRPIAAMWRPASGGPQETLRLVDGWVVARRSEDVDALEGGVWIELHGPTVGTVVVSGPLPERAPSP